MTLRDRDRKLLWGRSGNRCAVCRRLLVLEKTSLDREAIIGDECHIVSPRGGPRAGSEPAGGFDCYENLILLCKIDHKRVDDQSRTFPTTALRAMKEAHEKWVELLLSVEIPRTQGLLKAAEGPQLHRVSRVLGGSELLRIVGGVQGYDFDSDELEDAAEAELVGRFLQRLHDVGDMFDDLESGDRSRARFELAQEMKELEAAGFVVYGSAAPRPVRPGDFQSQALVATIRVMRITNPAIWDPDVLEEVQRALDAQRADDSTNPSSPSSPTHDPA